MAMFRSSDGAAMRFDTGKKEDDYNLMDGRCVDIGWPVDQEDVVTEWSGVLEGDVCDVNAGGVRL